MSVGCSIINEVKRNGTDEGIDPAVPGNEGNEGNNPCNEWHQRASVGHVVNNAERAETTIDSESMGAFMSWNPGSYRGRSGNGASLTRRVAVIE